MGRYTNCGERAQARFDDRNGLNAHERLLAELEQLRKDESVEGLARRRASLEADVAFQEVRGDAYWWAEQLTKLEALPVSPVASQRRLDLEALVGQELTERDALWKEQLREIDAIDN